MNTATETPPFADVVLYITTPGDPSVGINGWHAKVIVTAVMADVREVVIRDAKRFLGDAFQQVFDDGPVSVRTAEECA
jgi:hypothetical protein